MTMLAYRALADRMDRFLMQGSVVYCGFVAPEVLDDPPVLDVVLTSFRERVLELSPDRAIALPEHVRVEMFSPAELTESWVKHAPFEPPPDFTFHAVIAFREPLS